MYLRSGGGGNKNDFGFTPQIVIGVWVGVDDPLVSLGKTQFGSKAAMPIFVDAIKML